MNHRVVAALAAAAIGIAILSNCGAANRNSGGSASMDSGTPPGNPGTGTPGRITTSGGLVGTVAQPGGTPTKEYPKGDEWKPIQGAPGDMTTNLPKTPEAERNADTSGEQFAHYQENEWVDAAKDAKSTFAIDVDTASYTIMRRDVLARRLPAPDSVRVEEYLNYFEYGYTPPATKETPFAIHLEAAPSPFAAGKHILRVGVKGYEVPEGRRQPVNLVFLIDVSGSMNGPTRLPLVVYALKQMVKKLNPADTLAIVVYAGAAGVVLPPTAVLNKEQIYDKLDSLQAGGSTAGGAGIELAYKIAETANGEYSGRATRVILCTDGDFNIGATGDDLLDLIGNYRDKGVYLSLLLFGIGNINDAYMEKMADKGNGNYGYVNSQSDANRVVGEKLVSTLQTIAKDVKIQVTFNPAVVARHRLIGYENRKLAHEQFRDDAVDAGELGAGHSVTALYELELAEADKRAPDAALAAVAMRWKAPTARVADPAKETNVAMMASEIRAANATTPGFKFAVAVAQFAQILRKSKHVQGATMEQILGLADANKETYLDRDDFARLVTLASDLPRN